MKLTIATNGESNLIIKATSESAARKRLLKMFRKEKEYYGENAIDDFSFEVVEVI